MVASLALARRRRPATSRISRLSSESAKPSTERSDAAASLAREPVLGRIEQRTLEVGFGHRRLEVDTHESARAKVMPLE